MRRDRRPRLSLDLLRGFRVAARHLSFTRAAQELFVTQPAISNEVRKLEEQLGRALFRRVNRTLQLTHTGEELYRAVDEALALIDATAERLAGNGTTLAVTTSSALASLWLAPRLPHFIRAHPGIDMRIAAINEMVDLEREHLDLAIQWVGPGADVPNGERLIDYKTFPVCSPALLRDRARPLRAPSDLAKHVLLDFDRLVDRRSWSDWEHWFDAMKIRNVKPAGVLRFSHYDQAIQTAIEGSGVAIGKRPHLTRHLREGVLCAPFGAEGVASLGGFYIVLAPGAAARAPVKAFIDWLKEEVRRDAQPTPFGGAVASSKSTPLR
jgi:DNA-binding transcriptional LysR family regulator